MDIRRKFGVEIGVAGEHVRHVGDVRLLRADTLKELQCFGKREMGEMKMLIPQKIPVSVLYKE